jgi:hypothetical protein
LEAGTTSSDNGDEGNTALGSWLLRSILGGCDVVRRRDRGSITGGVGRPGVDHPASVYKDQSVSILLPVNVFNDIVIDIL